MRERDDEDWEKWLQTNRVELNAMTTPEFIASTTAGAICSGTFAIGRKEEKMPCC